ncbi:argininosuccinate synthase [Cysteiniphilum sp. QT6929]|uniref:argininosuccinate synthase n=1 Tax=Cysteiniphilum sp. QT6929 TaxID=2975055 RepID=UPI0024B3C652|nr:argininosuccinate synthase [Cysteiniphilum sp. QT6929]WHN66516.1 argininosuccinate synthase [Cysteiniphilum sp. QT6929]
MKLSHVDIVIANSTHCHFASAIAVQIEESAKQRKTGIAKRSVNYLQEKIRSKHAVIAIDRLLNQIVGFCYIESWQDKAYVSNSGLIVFPEYRNLGLSKALKSKAFMLAREYYPNAKIFGLTTNPQVMRINYELGYEPAAFTGLTTDKTFWQGCMSCVNFAILQAKEYQNCLCTGMLYDPQRKQKQKVQKEQTEQQEQGVLQNNKGNKNNKNNEREQSMKVIVAFSGGLDTSFCVKYLQQEHDLEVHTVTVNTGGFTPIELAQIERRAYQLGAKSHQSIEVTKDFYQECVKFLIFANALKNNCYPLSVSAERAFQAMTIAKVANSMGITKIAHGCTGAGNDQVRFDLMFHILSPEAQIITPIRDLKLSRAATQEYLIKHGASCSESSKNYSINKGLWGTSVGGVETLSSHLYLKDEAWPTKIAKAHNPEETLKITFINGEPIALNDELSNSIQVIQKLNDIASQYGIGRDIHVGDTIINIKGRVGFEAPAPLILIKAHHLLEKHVLTKAQLKIKTSLSDTYAEMVHEGQFLDPAARDIEALLLSTQAKVTGEVFVKLYPLHFVLLGIQSEHDLMQAQHAKYGEENASFTGDDVKGFTKVMSTQLAAYYQLQNKDKSVKTTPLSSIKAAVTG